MSTAESTCTNCRFGHQTRRTGRPYTLVLVKLPRLFEREEQAQHQDEADLHWIRERFDLG